MKGVRWLARPPHLMQVEVRDHYVCPHCRRHWPATRRGEREARAHVGRCAVDRPDRNTITMRLTPDTRIVSIGQGYGYRSEWVTTDPSTLELRARMVRYRTAYARRHRWN